MDKNKAMRKIHNELINLTESSLYVYRKSSQYQPVLGEGSYDADIFFIGEAPGKKEAETGKPFCGASGKLLDALLQHIGLDRSSVYITNVVKDRPEENRDPTRAEIELYAPFLLRQIDIIQPKVIVTLGRFALHFVLEYFDFPLKSVSISTVHGTSIEGYTKGGKKISLIPLYHPAVALYNGGRRRLLFDDFEILKKFL
jgi:uracil-DNA glycosylase family 4